MSNIRQCAIWDCHVQFLTINSEHKHADDTKFLLWLYDTNIRKNMRLHLIFAKNKATFEEVALDDMRDLKSGCDLLTA